MPITPEHVGRRYPVTKPYLVSQAKIDEFRMAVGDRTTGPQAPGTFAMVIGALAWDGLFADAELGLGLHRTMHADQRFAWSRQLRAGDEINAVLVVDKVRNRGNVDMITVTVELSTTDGEQVCTATSTLIHTREEA
ncbi:FAS1-like dehydratase domain-containing protein [Aestuariimicrobium kwangyangense]|uniref:FAS1-like dehydratase domain-containing protein n=1 Tax=Aestuariimicrobium kwangyangense TaxID=396389 RepID=UPI0003B36EBB|nr:MaoC family dehydratase N-terminal domain-containing protein [Aestuariimicrobium kwangyangense]